MNSGGEAAAGVEGSELVDLLVEAPRTASGNILASTTTSRGGWRNNGGKQSVRKSRRRGRRQAPKNSEKPKKARRHKQRTSDEEDNNNSASESDCSDDDHDQENEHGNECENDASSHGGRSNGNGGRLDFPDVDQLVLSLYQLWEGKGYNALVLARLLNLAALAFTIAFMAALLLWVRWSSLLVGCRGAAQVQDYEDKHRQKSAGVDGTAEEACNLLTQALRSEADRSIWKLGTLAVFLLYWVYAAGHLVLREGPRLSATARFVRKQLAIPDTELQTMTWAQLVQRLCEGQGGSFVLCRRRHVDARDVANCAMRRDNYLIAMINHHVLPFGDSGLNPNSNVALNRGASSGWPLTSATLWAVRTSILAPMLDERGLIRKQFVHSGRGAMALKLRLRFEGALLLCAAPFVLLFLAVLLFIKHAEHIYSHPASLGARDWTRLAEWQMRNLNEMPHSVFRRLGRARPAASSYLAQFPSPIPALIAKFVTFVVGAFAAVLVVVALLEESLLEATLFGRNLVWYAAILGTILAISRAVAASAMDSAISFDPEARLEEVTMHTFFAPERWRGGAHMMQTRAEINSLFQYQAWAFLQEMSAAIVTPMFLLMALPSCVDDVLDFVRVNTAELDGLGHFCSWALFNDESLRRHGDPAYGSPCPGPPKMSMTTQGKLEKSMLYFSITYNWTPDKLLDPQTSALLNAYKESPPPYDEKESVPLQLSAPSIPGAVKNSNSWTGEDSMQRRHFPGHVLPSVVTGAGSGVPVPTANPNMYGDESQDWESLSIADLRSSRMSPFSDIHQNGPGIKDEAAASAVRKLMTAHRSGYLFTEVAPMTTGVAQNPQSPEKESGISC